MDPELAVQSLGGVASRRDLIALLGRHAFDNAVKSRRLAAAFPRAYCAVWDLDQPDVRQRAALISIGGDAALSHTTALSVRGLPAPAEPIHVTAYQTRHPRGVPGELTVHRTLRPLDAVEVDGVPVVPTHEALVSSWPMLAGPDQRAPAIEAWRRRIVSAQHFLLAAERMWWVQGIKDVRHLAGLLASGCESPLEMWGYEHVFNVPGLDDADRQRVVRVGGRTYRLDVAYEAEMLNIELDGRAYHSSPEQWERDTARDAALATVGWQTLRFSHRRLHTEIDACRREALAVRRARARQAG